MFVIWKSHFALVCQDGRTGPIGEATGLYLADKVYEGGHIKSSLTLTISLVWLDLHGR